MNNDKIKYNINTVMKKSAIITFATLILCNLGVCAQSSPCRTDGKTLRIDYIFSGTDKDTEIAVAELTSFNIWAGRNVNLDTTALKGNGQITMRDLTDSVILFRNSFSTLFQEWKNTEEATRVRKSFENVFLLPMPESKVMITVELFGFKGETIASLEHIVDPADILIRQLPENKHPWKYLMNNGSPQECIDIAVVAEGYTSQETELFYEDARTAMESILSYQPFDKMRNRFNFIAVALPSDESGVSIPDKGIWKSTALNSNFSTFYSDRYLTTLHLGDLHDALAGLPYEHIIILANTDNYGGGGIFNSYTLTTTHHQAFKPVVVHEFGHSFAGLGDEYFYDDQYVETYYPHIEPWEPNLTTLVNFDSKWKELLPDGIRIPTAPADEKQMWKDIQDGVSPEKYIGVYEGGGYQSKGVFRPFPDCRMRTNSAPVFCPACQAAIQNIINFHLVQSKTDAGSQDKSL